MADEQKDIDWKAVSSFFGDITKREQTLKVTIEADYSILHVKIPADRSQEFMKHVPTFNASVEVA